MYVCVYKDKIVFLFSLQTKKQIDCQTDGRTVKLRGYAKGRLLCLKNKLTKIYI